MPTKPSGKLLARSVLVRLFTLGPRPRPRPHKGQIKRILVIRPDHLGDLLFATPALDLLRRAFPNAHITGAVGPWGRALWADNPNLDALEVIPFPGVVAGEGNAFAPYKLLARTAKQIAGAGRYDLGVVLRSDHWWGAALLTSAGVPHRWGYGTPGVREWLTNSVRYSPDTHEVEQDLRLAHALTRSLGETKQAPVKIDRARGIPALTLPQPAEVPPGLAPTWLAASPNRRVVIHPGTAAANKLWTISGWAEVADRLTSQGYSVALTGSPAEQELCTLIAEAAASMPLNLAGRTASIAELEGVMQAAGMALGVDSGPLHIGDALGKRTLHLYGPSDEAIWGPWGDPNLHCAFRAPGTRPTGRLDVGSPQLEGGPEMRAITVEMVMNEIAAIRDE